FVPEGRRVPSGGQRFCTGEQRRRQGKRPKPRGNDDPHLNPARRFFLASVCSGESTRSFMALSSSTVRPSCRDFLEGQRRRIKRWKTPGTSNCSIPPSQC